MHNNTVPTTRTTPAAAPRLVVRQTACIETLRLTGASTITLGANAASAGIVNVITGNGATSITDSNGVTLNVNAAALANNIALTLVGSAAEIVTGLIGNITAGSLTVR